MLCMCLSEEVGRLHHMVAECNELIEQQACVINFYSVLGCVTSMACSE